jgi:SAM-dependent methyltransferase
MATRYRRKGLDPSARRMVELLEDRGVRGATVLEIGGGVGEIELELLRRGAASATDLEISPGYEEEAAALIAEAGMGGRVDRRLVDIAADPRAVPPADVVVAHRVVCCYPDHPRLLGSAADHARRQLVFSFPPRNAATRTVVGTQNWLFRLVRREYRAFAHPPGAMLGVLADHGLRPAVAHRGPLWQVATEER